MLTLRPPPSSVTFTFIGYDANLSFHQLDVTLPRQETAWSFAGTWPGVWGDPAPANLVYQDGFPFLPGWYLEVNGDASGPVPLLLPGTRFEDMGEDPYAHFVALKSVNYQEFDPNLIQHGIGFGFSFGLVLFFTLACFKFIISIVAPIRFAFDDRAEPPSEGFR